MEQAIYSHIFDKQNRQMGRWFKYKVEDIFVYEGQRYDIERVEEPGETGIFTILYCNKRNGVGGYGISAGKEGI